jgi:hypothetical protein
MRMESYDSVERSRKPQSQRNALPLFQETENFFSIVSQRPLGARVRVEHFYFCVVIGAEDDNIIPGVSFLRINPMSVALAFPATHNTRGVIYTMSR